MQTPASWHRRSFILLAVSVLGTLLAGFALVFDGWIDALALYVACALVLALLLCRFAGQLAQPQAAASIDGGRADPGVCPADLVLTRARGGWTGAERAAIRVALGNTASTD